LTAPFFANLFTAVKQVSVHIRNSSLKQERRNELMVVITSSLC